MHAATLAQFVFLRSRALSLMSARVQAEKRLLHSMGNELGALEVDVQRTALAHSEAVENYEALTEVYEQLLAKITTKSKLLLDLSPSSSTISMSRVPGPVLRVPPSSSVVSTDEVIIPPPPPRSTRPDILRAQRERAQGP